MSNNTAIKVVNVSKTFRLPHEKNSSIKNSIINFYKKKKGFEKQQALKDISFEVKKGEFFGLVGRNGSGKSTLLKIISNIYTPDSGSVHINGRLTPFIELGVGFNPELSGRENVYLNGALLGFNRREMDEMYDEIVEFAELERFMDQKLKNYSSGMQVRLAFSIAIQANTDILVLDEVLAVGDAAFQQKCNDYFDTLKKNGKTVILVTHSMESVNRFCDKALLIEDSVIKDIGSPEKVAKQYTLDNLNAEKKVKAVDVAKGTNKKLGQQIKTLDIKLLSSPMLSQSEMLEFEVIYQLNEAIEVDLGVSIIRQNISIIEQNTKGVKLNYAVNKKHKIRYKLPLKDLKPGRYKATIAIFEKKDFVLIGFNIDSCSFIISGKEEGGILAKSGEWSVV